MKGHDDAAAPTTLPRHPTRQCISCPDLRCLDCRHWRALSRAAAVCKEGTPSSSTDTDGNHGTMRCNAVQYYGFVLLEGALRAARAGPAGEATVRDAELRMLLHGVPRILRPRLWPLLSGAAGWRGRFNEAVYHRLGEHPDDPAVSTAVAKDVGRSFPHDPRFARGGAGVARLSKLLLRYAAFDHKVGYTQGMAYLAGMLLVEGLSDEDAFWSLIAVTHDERWDLRSIYAPELYPAEWRRRADDAWQRACLRSPGLREWAHDTGNSVDALLLPFVPGLFINRLPPQLAARVIDALLGVGWSAISSLFATLLSRAWAAAPPRDAFDHGDDDAALLLPAMYEECACAEAELLESSWWNLLPPEHPSVSMPRWVVASDSKQTKSPALPDLSLNP